MVVKIYKIQLETSWTLGQKKKPRTRAQPLWFSAHVKETLEIKAQSLRAVSGWLDPPSKPIVCYSCPCSQTKLVDADAFLFYFRFSAIHILRAPILIIGSWDERNREVPFFQKSAKNALCWISNKKNQCQEFNTGGPRVGWNRWQNPPCVSVIRFASSVAGTHTYVLSSLEIL